MASKSIPPLPPPSSAAVRMQQQNIVPPNGKHLTQPELPPSISKPHLPLSELPAGPTVIEISDSDDPDDPGDPGKKQAVPVTKQLRSQSQPQLSMEEAAVNDYFSEEIITGVHNAGIRRIRICRVRIPATLAGCKVEMLIGFDPNYPNTRPKVPKYTGCNEKFVAIGNSILQQIWRKGNMCLLDFFKNLVTKIKEGGIGHEPGTPSQKPTQGSSGPGSSRENPIDLENLDLCGKPKVGNGALKPSRTIALNHATIMPALIKAPEERSARKKAVRFVAKQGIEAFGWVTQSNFTKPTHNIQFTIQDLHTIRILEDYPPPMPVLKSSKHQELARVHHSYNQDLNNERLEFFGDRICAKMMAEMLHEKYQLSPHQMTIVSQKCLTNLQFAIFNSLYGLHSHILTSNREIKVKDRGDAWEALIAGMYLDCERNTDEEIRLYNWWVELLTPWVNLCLSKLSQITKKRAHVATGPPVVQPPKNKNPVRGLLERPSNYPSGKTSNRHVP